MGLVIGVPENVIFLGFLFLKDLKSIESVSDHTLRAYAGDLTQFFADKKGHHLKISEESNIEIFLRNQLFLWNSEAHPAMEMTSKQFLQLLTQALNTWSPLSASTRNRKLSCLKSFSKWLAKNNYIDTDLSHRIPSPKVPQKIPHFLSVDEVLSLIQTLKEENKNSLPEAQKDLLLVYLLYGLGLRVSEACALEWKDIQWNQAALLVKKGKGQQQRWVAIPEKVLEFLKQIKTNHYPFLFGENPLGTRQAWQRVRNAGIRAGLNKPLNPHALRHSFATHLLSSGSDLRILQELLGHKSLAATQKYTHLSMSGLARVMESHHPLGDGDQKK